MPTLRLLFQIGVSSLALSLSQATKPKLPHIPYLTGIYHLLSPIGGGHKAGRVAQEDDQYRGVGGGGGQDLLSSCSRDDRTTE